MKTQRLEIRLSAQDKQLVQQLADRQQTTITELLLSLVDKEASIQPDAELELGTDAFEDRLGLLGQSNGFAKSLTQLPASEYDARSELLAEALSSEDPQGRKWYLKEYRLLSQGGSTWSTVKPVVKKCLSVKSPKMAYILDVLDNDVPMEDLQAPTDDKKPAEAIRDLPATGISTGEKRFSKSVESLQLPSARIAQAQSHHGQTEEECKIEPYSLDTSSDDHQQ